MRVSPRRRALFLCGAIVCLAISLSASFLSARARLLPASPARVAESKPAVRADDEPGGPKLTLLPLPRVGPGPEPEIADAEAEQVRGLIRSLAAIDRPDFGLSPTLSGDDFAPVASSARFRGGRIFIDHRLKRDASFEKLVELGPRALPALLDALGDGTPTGLTIEHESGFGGMWFGHEIHGNPTNRHEADVLKGVKAAPAFEDRDTIGPGHYTVRVGDVAFAVIGQITNRHYAAVRYKPTACIVVNSPTHDPRLAGEVREIWGKADHRRKLLGSLLVDFCTRGQGSDNLQAGAAMRLAYYFPEQASPIVAARLLGLDVTSKDILARLLTNGVREGELLGAVAWSPDPVIKAAVVEMFEKTEVAEILLATLPALGGDRDGLAFARLGEFLGRLPEEESGPNGDGRRLLDALGARFPDRAEAAFREYLRPGSTQRRQAVCQVLRETCRPLAIKLLPPMLSDRSDTGWGFGMGEDRQRIRVCDEAAETLAGCVEGLTFRNRGTPDGLDRQIEEMSRKLSPEVAK